MSQRFGRFRGDRDFLRKLGEAEPLRSLRLQKERIEAERERQVAAVFTETEADRLRREIRNMGHEPCA